MHPLVSGGGGGGPLVKYERATGIQSTAGTGQILFEEGKLCAKLSRTRINTAEG